MLTETAAAEGVSLNTSMIFAQGYCFGGSVVIELARAGEDLVAVSSFHGVLANRSSYGATYDQEVKAAIQVHHAEDDFQGPESLDQLEADLTGQNVAVWQATTYGNVEHSWTNPGSTSVYSEHEARMAHANTRALFSDFQGLVSDSSDMISTGDTTDSQDDDGHSTDSSWQKPDTPSTVVSREVSYTLEGTSLNFTGFVAYPKERDNCSASLPGLLLIHDASGLDDMEKYRSEEMALYCYFVFAADLSGGEDVLQSVMQDQTQFMLRARGGLQMLTETAAAEGVSLNTSMIFAQGYCFGGSVVIELARAGEDLVAVSSFHGVLANRSSYGATYDQEVKAAIQVHHAEDDFQGPESLDQLEADLTGQNVAVWQATTYGNVEHSWTNPGSTSVYSEHEARMAHANTRALFSDFQEFVSDSTNELSTTETTDSEDDDDDSEDEDDENVTVTTTEFEDENTSSGVSGAQFHQQLYCVILLVAWSTVW